MFNRRFVYNDGTVDAPQENEKSGAEKAQDRMREFMMPQPDELSDGAKNEKPEVSQQNRSVEDESKSTDEMARADIISIFKEGKVQNPRVAPADMDAATFKAIMDDLMNKVPKGKDNHFSTHFEALTSTPGDMNDPEGYYFMAVNDATANPPVRIFVKKGSNFSVAGRTFLRDVDDATYKNLTGQDRPKKS
jgi:hypothetical protein